MKGFRIKFLRGIIETMRVITWLLVMLVLVILIAIIFIPETIVAFIVAICRDKWRMWLSPFLEQILKAVWDWTI